MCAADVRALPWPLDETRLWHISRKGKTAVQLANAHSPYWQLGISIRLTLDNIERAHQILDSTDLNEITGKKWLAPRVRIVTLEHAAAVNQQAFPFPMDVEIPCKVNGSLDVDPNTFKAFLLHLWYLLQDNDIELNIYHNVPSYDPIPCDHTLTPFFYTLVGGKADDSPMLAPFSAIYLSNEDLKQYRIIAPHRHQIYENNKKIKLHLREEIMRAKTPLMFSLDIDLSPSQNHHQLREPICEEVDLILDALQIIRTPACAENLSNYLADNKIDGRCLLHTIASLPANLTACEDFDKLTAYPHEYNEVFHQYFVKLWNTTRGNMRDKAIALLAEYLGDNPGQRSAVTDWFRDYASVNINSWTYGLSRTHYDEIKTLKEKFENGTTRTVFDLLQALKEIPMDNFQGHLSAIIAVISQKLRTTSGYPEQYQLATPPHGHRSSMDSSSSSSSSFTA